MRIGVNALYLIPGGVGGTERYLRCLLPEMARLAPEEEFVVFVGREARGSFAADGFKEIASPFPSETRPVRAFYEQAVLPLLCRRLGLDVLFCPGYTAPLLSPLPVATTVHDMQHRLRPENFRPWERLGYRLLADPSIRRSEMLLTVSETSAADIARVYGLPRRKIRVTPLAPAGSFGRAVPKKELAATLGELIEKPYLLCVASLLPHKGLETLLDGYALLLKDGLTHRLAVAGFFGHHTARVREKISRLGLGRRVRLLGWVEPRKMPALYAGASLLLAPSTFEGFGLPVVEAMAQGTPVLAAGAKSIPETAGGACLLFKVDSPGELASQARRLLGDEGLRRRLVAAGKARARQLGWEAAARGTLDALREAHALGRAGGRGPRRGGRR